jgi:hypothetical protein
VHAALLEAKDELRGFQGPAIEGIRGAKEGQDFSQVGAIVAVAWDQMLIAAAVDAIAVIEREERQGAAVGAVDRQRTIGKEQSRSDDRMIVLIDRAANIVHERSGAEQVAMGRGEIVEVGGEIEQGGSDADDTLLVFDAFEASGNPMCDRA